MDRTRFAHLGAVARPHPGLQIPYDVLNRYNRVSLKNKNSEMVDSINFNDYSITQSHDDKYLDHFCVATK